MADINYNMFVNINKKIVTDNQSKNTAITAGNSGSVVVTPPEGSMGNINGLDITIPVVSGASSGTHSIIIQTAGMGGGRILTVTSAYNAQIQIRGLSVTIGTPIPAAESAVAICLGNIAFSNGSALNIIYANNTNASQSGTRNYLTQYIKEAETDF